MSLRAPIPRPAGELVAEQPLGQRHLAEMAAAVQSWRAPAEDSGGAIRPSHQAGSYLYAVGRLGVKFPSLSVEKEFFQAHDPQTVDKLFDVDDEVGLLRLNVKLEDPGAKLYRALYGALFEVLEKNVYIARDMCWILRTLNGMELFVIEPPSEEQLEVLIAALEPGSADHVPLWAFIGQELPASANPFCDRLGLPAALMSTLFIPPADSAITGADPSHLALVQAILGLTENAGNTASDRALNWLLANDLEVYKQSYDLAHGTGDQPAQRFDLVDVRTRTVLGGGHREQVDVIFEYQGASSGVTRRLATGVDVTGEFPYQESVLEPFIGRR